VACPPTIDICRSRGDTYPFVFTIKDSSGVPIDITGFSFSLAVDPNPDPSTSANNLFVLAGTIIDGPNGRVQFSLSGAQSDQQPQTAYYDLQMTDGTGAKRTVAQGEFRFEQDVTKT
jgi:hypothetical protein